MLASEVMTNAAALLNDTALTNFTYSAQLPFLNMALNELRETLELNNIPVTNAISSIIPVTTAMFDIGGSTGPALPTGLIEIQRLYERQTGTSDTFIPMTRVEFLPLVAVLTNSLGYWTWQGEVIRFIGSNSNRDVKIEYIATVISPVTSSASSITLINAASFLGYRTAALCAEFIGENPARASELNTYAGMAADRFLGINVKGAQEMSTRRKPFMAAYKTRGIY